MAESTWNFDKMLKGLPNLNTTNAGPDQSVSWHLFDISHNYINDRINWDDNVIELKDSKQLLCYSFYYYGDFKAYTPITDIKSFNGGMIDVEAIRTYFKQHAFKSIFYSDNTQDNCGSNWEITEMCNLSPESFIIMPIYETTRTMYVALLNINKAYGEYLKSIYNGTDIGNSNGACVAKFFNLTDVTQGLQTHTSITGVKQATSFNLFKSLYMTNIGKHTRLGPNYKFDAYKLTLNDNCEIPIILLFNGYNYFPRFQVVWSTDKIFLNLPGCALPSNDSLLSANKVLKVYRDKSDTDTGVEKIPRVMVQNSNTITMKTKSKQKPVKDWHRDYKKYCGEETTQYTSMTKLLCSMNRLQLETADYIS